MEGRTSSLNTSALKKPLILLAAGAALMTAGLHNRSQAAPGFDVGGMTLSPFITAGYGRVVYGNMPSFKKMTENAFSPTAVTWKQSSTEKSADTIIGSLGVQLGNYFAISTGASTNTRTRLKGSFGTTVAYENKFTYDTQFYQIAKLMAGHPLFSNDYYAFLSLSANYEKLNAKYSESRIVNSSYSASGKNSARAVLPGVGLGLLVNLPRTNHHLGLQFEYEFIRGKNASRHTLLGNNSYQLFNRIPHRNQFLISLRYTI